MGRHEEGLSRLEQARKLNPSSELIADHLGVALWMAGRDEDALQTLQAAIERHPNRAALHWQRRAILETMGRYEEAAREREAAAHANGAPDRARRVRETYEREGYRPLMESDLEARREGREWGTVAMIYTGLGDLNQAFDALAQAVRARNGWMPFIKVDPRFKALQSDPRFGALLVQVGLAPAPDATSLGPTRSDRGVAARAPTAARADVESG